MAEQPIEPAALTAAGLLAAGAVEAQGGQAGTRALPGQAELAGLVRQAVTGRDLAVVLDDVDARPQDPGAVGALAQVLAVLAAQDRGFQGELARLVGQTEQDPTIGQLATTIAGHARVGKVVTIGHAGAVHVHMPLPPPQTVLDRLHRATTRQPLVANLPPRNSAFTGRADLLGHLHASLHPGQAAAVVQVQGQALHGLGGVGKTQLALEYAHRHADDYDLIWWIAAEQPAVIPGQLVALARRLGIPEAADQAETIAVLYDELRGRDRWLLIFDNAEDPADLRPWWPPGSGRVLVTSRNPSWSGLAATIAVDVLPRAEAIAFLGRRLDRDDPALDRLADALGDLPLALEQAAAYVDETAIAVNDYLDLLATHARELFQLGRPATTEQTIATTWTVSVQRLREQTPAAEDLLRLCAFLAAEDIPRTLPADHPDLLPERLASTARDPLGYQQAIGALRRYSLIRTSQDGQALSVHRLVQAVTRHQLSPEQERRWATAALHLVRAAFPDRRGDVDAWPDYARLLPHALAVVDHASTHGIDLEYATWLLREAGSYLSQRADHQQARTLLERALALDEARLGPDHPDTATSLHNLAIVLLEQGDLARARSLHERALQIRETRLGADHPDTAASLNNVANVLREQGDLAGARQGYERAVAIYGARLGDDHPLTAQSLDSLASVLEAQGDLDAARPLFERALQIRETRLGADHPLTAHSLDNLAIVVHKQGDLATARTLFDRAVAIRETRLGPHHPDTVLSRQNLAAVVAALDKDQ